MRTARPSAVPSWGPSCRLPLDTGRTHRNAPPPPRSCKSRWVTAGNSHAMASCWLRIGHLQRQGPIEAQDGLPTARGVFLSRGHPMQRGSGAGPARARGRAPERGWWPGRSVTYIDILFAHAFRLIRDTPHTRCALPAPLIFPLAAPLTIHANSFVNRHRLPTSTGVHAQGS